MGTLATGTFEITLWEERPTDGNDGGPKLTGARVTNAFRGGIEGEGTEASVMVSPADGPVTFVGLERVVGRLGDRSGSFVLRVSGTFEGVTAKGTWVVVPGAGTGELRGLRGEGGFVAHHGPEPIAWAGRVWEPLPKRHAAWMLDYDLE